jgi:acetyl-CoA synthetase
MGRPYPGHRVAVIDDDGRECPRGTPGDVALHRRDVHGDRDPVFFLGYWNNDAATRAKFTGEADGAPRPQQAVAAPRGGAQSLGRPGALPDSWCRTGDMAVMDADGYLWYHGRSDDVFKAAGYRIGPSEIENCLVKHPAVANAAVVPRPDAERGAVVKAYVVLAPGFEGDAALITELQQHVRGQLAPYEYPKEIEFIDALPMTTTGKVQRRVLRLREEERARAQG